MADGRRAGRNFSSPHPCYVSLWPEITAAVALVAISRARIPDAIVISDETANALLVRWIVADGGSADLGAIFFRDLGKMLIRAIGRGDEVACSLNLKIAVTFDGAGRYRRKGGECKKRACKNLCPVHFFGLPLTAADNRHADPRSSGWHLTNRFQCLYNPHIRTNVRRQPAKIL